jgi:3-methyladenine DNA glycosylase Tag
VIIARLTTETAQLGKFKKIHPRAIKLIGETELMDQLPTAKTARQLQATKDSDYLSEMSKCIFRAGFVWKVVENK